MATTTGTAKIYTAIVAASLMGSSDGLAQPANRLQPFVAENKLYAIHKPPDWKVKEDSRTDMFRILLSSPEGLSTVDFLWARNEEGKANALWFVSAFKQLLSQTHPGVALSEVFVSRDATRAVATVQFRAGQTQLKGKYYFESRPQGLSAQGYRAPESLMVAQRPLLLNIMASLAFSKGSGGAAPAGGAAARQPQFVQVPLVLREAPDRSLALKIPEDWQFLAGGGKVIAGARDGGLGFAFTSLSGNPLVPGASIAQGIIASRYLPPPQTLAWILQAFGHRNVKVLSSQPDQATMQQFTGATGRRCDAQDMLVNWTSAGGADCLGAFKMINSLPSPTGLWFTIMAGIWGPQRDFHRYLPMLEQVSSSFSINDQYARRYIQAGLENLRRLQQQTAAAMQDLNRAREQNQADWEARQARKDFMESKWDDYRRGNSYWVSELEGGKVYKTDSWGTQDTVTGNYYEGKGYNWVNFEGQNPRHPSETMREVSSYELQQLGRPR